MKYFAFAAVIANIQAEEMDIFEHTGITPNYDDTLFNPIVDDEPTDPCCHDCTAPLEKYHSVDHIMNNCGEACMDPSKFWLYKLFEPGLEKSETNTPCADRKYDDYKNTPTHGFGPVKMTLDLYGPHKDLGDDAAECEALGDDKTCDANDKCSWCVSGAVKPACKALEDAKKLPASIFKCDKVTELKDDASDCEAIGDDKSCDASDKCAWCKSAAVKPACKDLEDAKKLPSSIFQCDKISDEAIFLN